MDSFSKNFISVFDFVTLKKTDAWLEMVQSFSIDILISILYFFIGLVVIKIGAKVIRKLFHLGEESNHIPLTQRKAQTLSAVLTSVWRYTVYFFSVMIILDRFGIDTKSILAVAGVGGVAIGFGAQNLVKDVITGFFILLEDQFGVGDLISVNNMTGTVEEIGLRVTKVRDFTGTLYFIPNSMIGIVSNHNRGAQKAIVDVNISYEHNIDEIMEKISVWLEDFSTKHEEIVNPAQLLGIQNMTPSEIVLRTVVDCQPGTQGPIGRELRRFLKLKFDENNIEIPYQKIMMFEQAVTGGNKKKGENNG